MDLNHPEKAHEESSELPAGNDSASQATEIEPMTWSLLGRFFGVPLLIIGLIVAGAIVVVLLFGGPAAPVHYSLDDLLQELEATSGERSMGLLLPQEKILWQKAYELSERLKKKEVELTPAEIDAIANRLSAMVDADLTQIGQYRIEDEEDDDRKKTRSSRLQFVLKALARTEQPQAIDKLVEVAGSGQEPFVLIAIQELGNLHDFPAARRGIEPTIAVLQQAEQPEALIVACTVLSVLANRSDRPVIEALEKTLFRSDGEVEWAAALALARLGSTTGKSTLLDLLDRAFLEAPERYVVVDAAGVSHRYRLPPARVDEILVAAIDAAARLDDEEIWSMITGLASDPSPAVRLAAGNAVKDRNARSGP